MQMVADPKAGAALIEDMLKEGDAGVASGMHSYYHRLRPELNQTGPEDPTAHIAAFMLVRRELWYYTGSTGWFDRDFKWSSVYDDAAKCGRPLAPAMRPAPRVYTREYERCHVMVNCTKVSSSWPQLGCNGAIFPLSSDAHAQSPSLIPSPPRLAVEGMNSLF